MKKIALSQYIQRSKSILARTCTTLFYLHEESKEMMCVTNVYEHRLYEIRTLLHIYTNEDAEQYKEEIEALRKERDCILHEIGD